MEVVKTLKMKKRFMMTMKNLKMKKSFMMTMKTLKMKKRYMMTMKNLKIKKSFMMTMKSHFSKLQERFKRKCGIFFNPSLHILNSVIFF